MKAKIKVEKQIEIKTLEVRAGVRYWEDATVNGIDDEDGNLIPCRIGDYWCPVISIDSGVITNWEKGFYASIHYKICENGTYTLKDENGNEVAEFSGYVPHILDLYNDSFGDYIILNVDENGLIADWNTEPKIIEFFKA